MPPGSSALTAVASAGGQADLATMSLEVFPVLYGALIDADDRSDPVALARIGWQLFSKACTAQQARRETAGMLIELRSAARVVVAGEGSPGSVALLRDVLARRGWLPPPGATPLQVLAAPAALSRRLDSHFV
jgi:hypothetical protein